MKPTTLPRYVVRPCPYSPRAFAIVNRVSGEVLESGFFSRHAAEDYILREYERLETEEN